MTTGKFDENDFAKFTAALNNAFGDITPVLSEIGQIIVDSISENFDVGGRHGGNEWGGSDGATHTWIPSKRALGLVRSQYTKSKGPGMTLLDSGRLAASIVYSIGLDKQTIFVGSNVEYAAIHNFGGNAGRGFIGPMIPRPFAVLQSEDIQDIQDALTSFYARRLGDSFG